MSFRKMLLSVVLVSACAASVLSQERDNVHVAPNAPPDQPKQANSSAEVRKFEEAIQPHLKKAKETYPDAKKRFLGGLPPKHSFFITTRLRDEQGRFEQVFIAVKEIKKDVIKGVIWNDVMVVSGYKFGDTYSFPESDLIDWTITKPDGTEDGNFVGKFLDTYRPN